jgi:hypothetical protein
VLESDLRSESSGQARCDESTEKQFRNFVVLFCQTDVTVHYTACVPNSDRAFDFHKIAPNEPSVTIRQSSLQKQFIPSFHVRFRYCRGSNRYRRAMIQPVRANLSICPSTILILLRSTFVAQSFWSGSFSSIDLSSSRLSACRLSRSNSTDHTRLKPPVVVSES